jgi:hypothetical protein
LAALKALRATFKIWRDEPPLRPVTIPQPAPSRRIFRLPFWNAVRYAAVAALVTLALLGLSNTQIRWDNNGFSFHASLFPQSPPAANFYTKDEMKVILDRVLNISEESNRQMIQDMMDMHQLELFILENLLFMSLQQLMAKAGIKLQYQNIWYI